MTDLAAAPRVDDLEAALERHRVELTGYCYRMLGSGFEAEDAVQETMVRAWKAYDRFEGRSSLRSWLYRIATNTCLDLLRGRQRRALPVDMSERGTPDGPPTTMLPERSWVEPVPDARVVPEVGDPAELAVARESVRLAFVAALQHLPARQRAVLILREVLRWPAADVAALLETSVPSVNSALQRARATLASRDLSLDAATEPAEGEHGELLARYVDAFERYDLDDIVALLHEDVTLSMPPFALWLQGADAVRTWFLGEGAGCRGSIVVPITANGAPAIAQYRPHPSGEGHFPWSVQVLDVVDGRIRAMQAFLGEQYFTFFGLPLDPAE